MTLCSMKQMKIKYIKMV